MLASAKFGEVLVLLYANFSAANSRQVARRTRFGTTNYSNRFLSASFCREL
jgi:hypothetical protein